MANQEFSTNHNDLSKLDGVEALDSMANTTRRSLLKIGGGVTLLAATAAMPTLAKEETVSTAPSQTEHPYRLISVPDQNMAPTLYRDGHIIVDTRWAKGPFREAVYVFAPDGRPVIYRITAQVARTKAPYRLTQDDLLRNGYHGFDADLETLLAMNPIGRMAGSLLPQ
jgi:hypothetical protein